MSGIKSGMRRREEKREVYLFFSFSFTALFAYTKVADEMDILLTVIIQFNQVLLYEEQH